jgi:hypothetical protein
MGMINLDALLDSSAFWIGVFLFFVVLGKMIAISATSESKSNKKGK